MPTFATPGPIDLAINLQVGAIEVVAGDRTDTVVTVSPTNPSKEVDRRGAEATTVDLDGERVVVVGPKPRLSWLGPTESVDVTVELPAGSRLSAEISVGTLRATGHLGATRAKAMTGAVELESVDDLWLRAGHGNATLGRAGGDVEITADHGNVRVGSVGGDATLKASHGTIQVEEAGGEVDARSSYGDVTIARALSSVTARTAYGSVQVHEACSGSVQVESGYGEIVVAVQPGIPAWLDLSSKVGRVRNQLDDDRSPDEDEQAVAVRARTQHGDITIRRAR